MHRHHDLGLAALELGHDKLFGKNLREQVVDVRIDVDEIDLCTAIDRTVRRSYATAQGLC